MSTALELQFLGGYSASYADISTVDLKSAKARALFCYLAVTKRPHLRASLTTLLWGDLPEANARTYLRKALSHLRAKVGTHLVVERQYVAFNEDVPHWIDVGAFETAVAPKSTNTPLTTKVAEQMETAVTLYQGDFLDGFHVRNTPAFDEWVLMQRIKLRDQLFGALHLLANHYAEQQLYDPAIRALRRVIALEPWHEDAHYQLMHLLNQNGQRAAALAQFETCRQTLAKEFGVTPSAETHKLHETIRSGEIQPRASVASSHITHDNVPHNLPIFSAPIIGRETELRAFDTLIADPGVRLISIVGPGGMGKTRLAIASARRQLLATEADSVRGRFPHGVYLVSLASLTTADMIVPTLVEILNIRLAEQAAEQYSARQQLLAFMQHKQMLLIFDNCEHLLASVKLFAEILRTAPSVVLMTTSRERLRLREEHVYPIQGLAYPDVTVPNNEEAAHYPAVKLFLSSAQSAAPEFTLTPEALLTLRHICHMVGGMPLALEMAAAWVAALPLHTISTEIKHNLDFLAAQMHGVPERHRSMRAVFDTTWQRLGKDDRRVFAQLSIFHGGFTRMAAQNILKIDDGHSSILPYLATLVNKTLLSYNRARDRYAVHELLRQYAAVKLAEDPEQERSLHGRYATYYLTTLQQKASILQGPAQQAALADIASDIENVHAAWNWAIAEKQYHWLDQALEGLGTFYWWRNRLGEGETAFRSACESIKTAIDAAHQRIYARLATWLCAFWTELGLQAEACQLMEEILQLLQQLADAGHNVQAETALALFRYGQLPILDRQQARSLLEQSLVLYQTIGDKRGTARLQAELSVVAWERGDFVEARAYAAASLVSQRALGNPRGIAGALWGLCIALRDLGEMEQAIETAEQCLAIYEELGDGYFVAKGHVLLGRLNMFNGRFATSSELIAQGIKYWEQQNQVWMATYFRAALSLSLALSGSYADAAALASQALAEAREQGAQDSQALALQVLGIISIVNQRFLLARDYFDESILISQAYGTKFISGISLAFSGYVLRGLGQKIEARQRAIEALQASIGMHSMWALLTVLPCAALLLADDGVIERAVELYALAVHYPFVGNSPTFAAIADEIVAGAAANLSPEVVEAAKARGQALDLWDTAVTLVQELRP